MSACLSFVLFAGSAGGAPWVDESGGVDVEIVFARVAGIDVHKRQVTVAVRVPGDQSGGGESRVQLVRRFSTFYGALREMAEWLRAEEITHVAMEATGVYWRPAFHALAEVEGFEIVLCNAHH